MRATGRSAMLAMACALLAVAPAHAATGDVDFGATIAESCSIVITQDGVLGVRPSDQRVLNSANFGGRPGRAIVTASDNSFTISVDQPVAFDSQPADDTAPNDFRASYRVTGATNITRTPDPEPLNAGNNNVRVHLRVSKPQGESFAGGDYAATVVLRCE